MDELLVWTPPHDERAALATLPGVTVRVTPDDPGSAPELDRVRALVLGEAPLPPLERMGSLAFVQALSVGVEGLPALMPPGVPLCNGRGVHDGPVAEWVLAALLADARDLAGRRDAQRAHRWERELQRELDGARVLIAGYGSIGAAVEARLAPFGSEIVRVARAAREGVHPVEQLPQLLPQADAVVLLMPGTPATRGLFDARMLAAMRDGALLVNAGRGELVDTDALLAELNAERLRAVLDVTDPEPLPAGHPLWDAPGLLVTPHVAGNSPRWRERGYALVRDQLARLQAGEPLRNVVRGDY